MLQLLPWIKPCALGNLGLSLRPDNQPAQSVGWCCSETENVKCARASFPSGRSAPPHTRLEQPTERGRFPRHARISPVFAGCVPATSVSRNSDHRREAAAGGDGSGTIFPPVTRRRCGTVAGSDAKTPNPTASSPCRTYNLSTHTYGASWSPDQMQRLEPPPVLHHQETR